MKFLSVISLLLFLSGCTQDGAIKNVALRHVIIQFDEQLKTISDQKKAAEIKSKTKIEVTGFERTSETEAVATVHIHTVSTENTSVYEPRDVQIQLQKNTDWSVVGGISPK